MLRPKKKKLNNPDWDEEIRKLDEATQLKDSWRYISVGKDVWKMDYKHNYDPTDDMIDAIDRKYNPTPEPTDFDLPSGVEMIERLEPQKQKVVFYYLWDGMSFSKIGKVLGFTKQRSHHRSYRARLCWLTADPCLLSQRVSLYRF